ncbi:MAG: hypothetical protein ACKO96_46140, partial [Flammeovirgaceae bacterium]
MIQIDPKMKPQSDVGLKKYRIVLAIELLLTLAVASAMCQSELKVDHLSGRANVYIPLASINSGDLSCSVGLVYSG